MLEHLARQHLETCDVWSVALIAAGGGREGIEREKELWVRERERERKSESGREREKGTHNRAVSSSRACAARA